MDDGASEEEIAEEVEVVSSVLTRLAILGGTLFAATVGGGIWLLWRFLNL